MKVALRHLKSDAAKMSASLKTIRKQGGKVPGDLVTIYLLGVKTETRLPDGMFSFNRHGCGIHTQGKVDYLLKQGMLNINEGSQYLYNPFE